VDQPMPVGQSRGWLCPARRLVAGTGPPRETTV
jgi:hypothetical protein